MKILIMGDPHGNTRSIAPKITMARVLGIQKVLVCGDFGLWTHKFAGVQYLDEIQRMAEDAQLTVYAIGGNHENWDHWEWAVDNMPTSHGWAMIRSRVAIAPKVHTWRWNGKKFAAAGGGVSVDRDWFRLPMENGTYRDEYGNLHPASGPRTLYWPNETLTDADVEKISNHGFGTDYLITHDCSNYTPWKERLKDDPDSEDHRRKIDKVIRATQPNLHFHGHMHEQYDWVNTMSHGYEYETQTYGFENDLHGYSWGILDTDTDKFTWRDSGEEA